MLDSKRREFIALLGGGGLLLAAKVRRARGQQPAMRRIGVLMGLVAGDSEAQSRVVAFENGLRKLGWVKGRNLSIEYRWAGDGHALRETLAREPNGGLMVLPDISMTNYREAIVALAARHHIPAIYPFRFFAASGGLMSYGTDVTEVFWRAAGYVDRILKGTRPGELPIQAPNKYELVVNLKTARALGLEVPPTLLARADEVIE
jgi:hypothetical protein